MVDNPDVLELTEYVIRALSHIHPDCVCRAEGEELHVDIPGHRPSIYYMAYYPHIRKQDVVRDISRDIQWYYDHPVAP